jgi:hypothetical protein
VAIYGLTAEEAAERARAVLLRDGPPRTDEEADRIIEAARRAVEKERGWHYMAVVSPWTGKTRESGRRILWIEFPPRDRAYFALVGDGEQEGKAFLGPTQIKYPRQHMSPGVRSKGYGFGTMMYFAGAIRARLNGSADDLEYATTVSPVGLEPVDCLDGGKTPAAERWWEKAERMSVVEIEGADCEPAVIDAHTEVELPVDEDFDERVDEDIHAGAYDRQIQTEINALAVEGEEPPYSVQIDVSVTPSPDEYDVHSTVVDLVDYNSVDSGLEDFASVETVSFTVPRYLSVRGTVDLFVEVDDEGAISAVEIEEIEWNRDVYDLTVYVQGISAPEVEFYALEGAAAMAESYSILWMDPELAAMFVDEVPDLRMAPAEVYGEIDLDNEDASVLLSLIERTAAMSERPAEYMERALCALEDNSFGSSTNAYRIRKVVRDRGGCSIERGSLRLSNPSSRDYREAQSALSALAMDDPEE